MPLPTFIIASPQRCGTTSLWQYLREHPEVCPSRIKEPRFFSNIEGELDRGTIGSGPLRSGNLSMGREWYESLFEACEDLKVRGEASTHYFSAADSASLIESFIPDVRLIFLLRDPVARIYSHYWQERKRGLNLPSFTELVQTNHPRFQYYSHVSSYKIHLERFFAEFDRQQYIIIVNENLKDKLDMIFEHICLFLEIDPSYKPVSINNKFNQSQTAKIQWLNGIMLSLSKEKITNKLPNVIRSPLGKVRRTITKMNVFDDTYPPMPASLREQLIKNHEEDIVFVEKTLDMNLSDWKK